MLHHPWFSAHLLSAHLLYRQRTYDEKEKRRTEGSAQPYEAGEGYPVRRRYQGKDYPRCIREEDEKYVIGKWGEFKVMKSTQNHAGIVCFFYEFDTKVSEVFPI